MKKQLFYIVSSLTMFVAINSSAQTDTVKSNTENKFRIEIQPLSLLQSLTYSAFEVKRLTLNVGFSYRITSKLWLKSQIGYFQTVKNDSLTKESLYSNKGIAAKFGAEWINQIEPGVNLGIYYRLAFSTNEIYSVANIRSDYYGNYQKTFNENLTIPWSEIGFRIYFDPNSISIYKQKNKNKLYLGIGPELMITNGKPFDKDYEIIQINGWGTPGFWGYRKSNINLRIGFDLGYTF